MEDITEEFKRIMKAEKLTWSKMAIIFEYSSRSGFRTTFIRLLSKANSLLGKIGYTIKIVKIDPKNHKDLNSSLPSPQDF